MDKVGLKDGGLPKERFEIGRKIKGDAEVSRSERVVRELTSEGGRAGQYATGWSHVAHLIGSWKLRGGKDERAQERGIESFKKGEMMVKTT